MNPPCGIETGLFKKKPCGQISVTKCANCEQPLCKQHAVAQKPGVFMCKDCDTAEKQIDKSQAKREKEKRDAEMMKSLANPGAPKPRQPGAPGPAPAAAPAKPAAAASAKPGAAPAPAQPAPKPADDAPLEFTPAAKPSAADDIPPTIEYRPEPKKK